MTANLENLSRIVQLHCPVKQDIYSHVAWLGKISGLKAEKMLRGYQVPYLYVLREGECEGDFYVTYVLPNQTIFHQPFMITETDTGWYYENGCSGSITPESRLDDILYLIMHCEKGQCQPLGC
jgi:hypothetical protein